jgi:5-methylthioadenosine/S-adenosylhomocysteine deaminase
MPAWVSSLLALRQAAKPEPAGLIRQAVSEIRATGTSLVGDVANGLASWDALADSDLSAVLFRELIGFNAADPEHLVRTARAELDALTPLAWIRTAVVPHAPYSVSAALLRAIAAVAAGADTPVSVHLGESREELEFLQMGTGAWRRLLEELGVWTDSWQVPRCWPVEYLERFGLVNDRLLAVHCVQLSDDELSQLAMAGATVVTCPRSNRWTGAGTPPIARFYKSGVRVAIGTDSLASVEDLNLFAEMAQVRRLAPEVPASSILRSATLDGAAALGFGDELGSIEPGKRAELIGVRIPAGVEDVEEYLLGGISERDVQWLDPGWA